MRIYIDEAGTFMTPSTPHSYSLVLALMLPSAIESEIFYEFLRLRDSWSIGAIEIKGSILDEPQAAQVVDFLSRYELLVEFFAIDMATHPANVVDDFKNRQAAEVVAHLTPAHNPGIVSQLQNLAQTIRKMPNQLFVQAFLTMRLVLEVVKDATRYFVQRLPEELGNIAWIVDQKNHSITDMEEMWTTLILPVSESHFAKEPVTALIGADYSHFHLRYGFTTKTIDEEMARHLEWLQAAHAVRPMTEDDTGINSTLLLSEQRHFTDSRESLGLQLADMLVTILRRALNEHLQYRGWKDFGNLLVRKQHLGSSFLQLGNSGPQKLKGHGEKVCRALDARAKSMLL